MALHAHVACSPSNTYHTNLRKEFLYRISPSNSTIFPKIRAPHQLPQLDCAKSKNRISSKRAFPARCSSGEDATSAGSGPDQGLSLIERNLRRRAEKRRLAAKQANDAPEKQGTAEISENLTSAGDIPSGPLITQKDQSSEFSGPSPEANSQERASTQNEVAPSGTLSAPLEKESSSKDQGTQSPLKEKGSSPQAVENTSQNPTTFPNGEVLPALPAGAGSRSPSAQTQGRVDRWQKMGIPVSSLFFGPDGKKVPVNEEMDRSIFEGFETTGMEQALRWKEGQRKLLMDDVIKGSGFNPIDKGNIVVTRRSATFLLFGTFEREPADVIRTVQANLDRSSLELTAVLVEIRSGGQVAGLSFLPNSSLLTFTLPGPFPFLLSLSSLVLSFSLSSSLSTLAIDLPSLSILSLWQSSLSPLCLFVTFASSLGALSAVAARYRILHLLAAPVYLPSAAFGTFGVVTGYKGLLPGRSAAFDLALALSVAPLLTSAAIIEAGNLAGNATQIGEVPADYIFVPEIIFAHSRPLSQLASSLAAAVILPDSPPTAFPFADLSSMGVDVAVTSVFPMADMASGVPQLVMDPLVFGGLLALHASLMTLLPIGKLSGGLIVHSLFGPRIARLVTNAFIVGVGLKLCLSNLNDGVWWCLLMLSWVSRDGGGQPLRDSVTSPGIVRTVIGSSLTLAACTILLT